MTPIPRKLRPPANPGRFNVRIGARIAEHDYGAQWFGNFEEGDGIRHVFARLDQRTLGMNLRVNYAAARDLTLELYAEPFVSTGTYTDFRVPSETPDAASFADRFVPYAPPASVATAFRFRQLRTNAVARWEYRPGSTLYLVWSHGRQGSASDPARRDWIREYRDLLDLHPDNTFLIKVAYWLNR